MTFYLLQISVFLASFLLFQIELIIAKILLPFYGGSCFVWGACLVFFQGCLLAGYWFVHAAVQKAGIGRYRWVQTALLFIPLAFFPGRALVTGTGIDSLPLAAGVFLQLFLMIGPVFFVLSTVSVSLQRWVSATGLKERLDPYRLYAASNAGSLVALLTYPFLFEVVFDLGAQLVLWRAAYWALAALIIYLFVRIPAKEEGRLVSAAKSPVSLSDRSAWFFLSASGVMMFMATTNIVTYTVAPLPLLWIAPLGIYLVTFILSFKIRPWRPGWIRGNIGILLAVAGVLFIPAQDKSFSEGISAIAFCAATFLVCLYCHNRLSDLRPSHDGELTAFYLTLSAGGFTGGMFTAWVMPLVSKSFLEYLLAISIAAVIAWFLERKKAAGLRGAGKRWRLEAGWLVLPLLAWFWLPELTGPRPGFLYKKRNYYGIYEVTEAGGLRVMAHGSTVHGAQPISPLIRQEPSSFYSRTSPVGEILLSDAFRFNRIGVVGLGAGTLAVYTTPDQTVDFYELDPEVHEIARTYFSYLSLAKGKIAVVYGDARRSLNQAKGKKYDLLVVDAFGGDSIPLHLVNADAVKVYREHLTDQGILLFHISSRYFRLEPAILGIAEHAKAFAGYRATSGAPIGVPSAWMALTWDKRTFLELVVKGQWVPIAGYLKERHRLWTDAYVNILPVLDYAKIKRTVFKLRPFR